MKHIFGRNNLVGIIALSILSIFSQVSAQNRVTANLQVLYTFEEGSGVTVNDVSGVGQPLNLTIGDLGSVSWLSGGLSINSSTLLSSSGPAAKVISSVQSSNSITVEAWVKPSNVSQTGPARMVTVSSDPRRRNMTLGQEGDGYDVRLRTTSTSANGIPSIGTGSGVATLSLTHVVYTRDVSGGVRLYVNGVEVSSGVVSGDLSNWVSSYSLGLGNELTGDRPWLGEFHLVAVYSRALSGSEVGQNYSAGHDGAGGSVPVITQHPLDQTVFEGQTGTFGVAAVGAPPLFYQWQQDGVDIAGAWSSSYTTPATSLSDDGATFRCVVTNLNGGATSTVATLTVNAVSANAPVITSFTPTSGQVGDEITIFGSNFDGGATGAIRIMPLGNSITRGVDGSSDNSGYRDDLAGLLASTIAFDFVGTFSDGIGFDNHHQGTDGINADEILGGINTYLNDNPPDIVLLHIGTNDISGGNLPETVRDETSGIVDAIYNFNNNILIVLSSLIPRLDTKDDRITLLNALLQQLITGKSNSGYRIFYAANNEAFKANSNWKTDYMADRVHPNDVGYAVMAGAWFDAIVQTFDIPTVAFNGTSGSNFSVDSDSQIRATVPPGATSGQISVANNEGIGFSPTDFVVLGSSIALQFVNPDGEVQWQTLSTQTLAWESMVHINHVKLEYSPDAGQSWLTISERAPNTGRFVWRTPNITSNNYRLRISDADNLTSSYMNLGNISLAEPENRHEAPNWVDMRKALLEPSAGGSDMYDLNYDGHVNLFDFLTFIDSNGKSPDDKSQPIEGVKVDVAQVQGHQRTVQIPIKIKSGEPIRAFQLQIQYDATKIEFSDKLVTNFLDPNMLVHSRISHGTVDIFGYILKKEDAVHIDGVLMNLSGGLKSDFKVERDLKVSKKLFASRSKRVLTPSIDDIGDVTSSVPTRFNLSQNYPNPFNPNTKIRFSLPAKTEVRINIYNLRGELVRTLLNEEKAEGRHSVVWDGKDARGVVVASGTYIYRVKAGKWKDSKKMILMK